MNESAWYSSGGRNPNPDPNSTLTLTRTPPNFSRLPTLTEPLALYRLIARNAHPAHHVMTVHTAMADGGAVVHFEVTALGEHVGRVRPYELSPTYASDRVSLPVTTPGARILRLADLTGGQWGDLEWPCW